MITFEGILIGTGILWALNAILVAPLTNYLVNRKLSGPAYAHLNGNMLIVSAKAFKEDAKVPTEPSIP